MPLSYTLTNSATERALFALATSAIALVSYRLLIALLEHFRLSKIPTVGADVGNTEKRRQAYLAGARKLYNEGYKKFKDGVFKITTSRDSNILVLAPRFLPELKKLPDTVLSMEAAVDETMETKYTQIETTVPIIPHTIKTQLTPSLPLLNEKIADEAEEALKLELPANDDWTDISIHHALTRIVAMVSGRVFIGEELCRTEKYLDAAINYTMEVMAAQRAVQQLRPWTRPFLARGLPEVKKLKRRIKEAEEFMQPVADLRKAASKSSDSEKPNDMLEWLIAGQTKFTDKNSQNLAQVQLGLSFAAIHTTALTATNAFYDLVALPDLADVLRDEILEALDKNGGSFTNNALQSMKRLDSFLKEVLRVHPATMASFQRKVMQPFTLSNGQVIPAGCVIEVPTVAIHSDSEVFPDAHTFDPLRFYKLRTAVDDGGSGGQSALNQFVSVSQSSLTFGYGRHACPGRFFAANEIKIIMAKALLGYDFKMTEGNAKRYPNIEFAHMSIPDMSKKIACRRREINSS